MKSDGRIKGEGALWPWLLSGLVLALALGIGAYLFFREAGTKEPPQTEAFQQITSYSGPRVPFKLYFQSPDGRYLRPESRDVREMSTKSEQVKEVVSELIRGPRAGLTPTFPAGARVKGVFIDSKGTAYVDFSRELQAEYPGGAWTETLTIYSLVNTLAQGFPEIKQVQVLVEGAGIDTLAGHIDTTRPFPPRPALDKE